MGSYGKLARRALETEMPIMVQIQEVVRGAKNAVSLAQGVVYWQPPKQALNKVKELVWEPSISRYGADEGIPELREALTQKLRKENKLVKSSVMVTAGANQMTGVTNILVGPGNPKTLHPDADWLERTLSETKPVPKVVTVVNPGNPSGTYIPEPLLKIAYPSEVEGFATQLLKIQDNIPICASLISQHLALYSMEMGAEWVTERAKDLVKNREMLREALSPLGEDAVKGGEGAIYLWAKLPEECADDDQVVRWLAKRHGVVLIPGGACGCPGHLRISFGGLPEEECKAAAERLRRGVEELVSHGLVE
ncbi:hypothetical protein Tsubulata_035193 [Turnera subulata]|uniref:Aminotransferase class I/classII large domain-containing protein n=1 Tax=Turnera subulata TaxID=218843 RepID=A0A9Q0J8W5_9ROSI|nr:hypothetical protein Tsubulata_035193 [Turnera subulata]